MKEIANYRIASIVSKILLWIGIAIILSSVGYAIFNLSHMDNVITIWASFMAIGVSFSFISAFMDILIKVSKRKHTSLV